MDFRSKKNKTEKPKFTIQLNRCNPSDFLIYEYLRSQKNVAGSIKLCLLEKALKDKGHNHVAVAMQPAIRVDNKQNIIESDDFSGAL
jgi:hypothetical protein